MVSDEQPLGSAYLLRERLGHGASGEVWSGADRSGTPYAFKLLRRELTSDPDVVRRFVQEREVLAGIDHPNVVRVRDLVVEGPTLAIVMDLVTGRDLRAVLQERGTIDPATLAAWGAAIAAGLEAAHRRGVVHRDIKPENVLLDEASDPPVPRLTDFGIARLLQEAREATMMVGTPQYMAPETMDGVRPTAATDLYALGIMLYELACGVPPFAGRGNTIAVLRAHALDVPGRPEGLPDPLWTLIAAMVAKHPADRPASAQAVADALTEMAPQLQGVPAAAVLTQPPAPAASGNLGSSAYDATVYSRGGGAGTSFPPSGMSFPPSGYGPPGYGQPGYPPVPGFAGPPGTAAYPAPGATPYPVPGAAPYPAPGAAPYPPPKRANPWIPVAIVVPLLMLVAVLVWVLLRPGQSTPQPPTPVAAPGPTATTGSSPAVTATMPPVDTSPTVWPDVVVPVGSVECARVGTGAFAAVAVTDMRVTTCPFARNVRAAYADSGLDGAAGTVEAFSPVTKRTYTMSCRPETGVVICEGGTNALVMIYGGRMQYGE